VGTQYGGTGATSFTQYGILYGNGTGALQATAAGATGQCLVSTTGAAPAWGSCSTGSLTGAGSNGQVAYFNSGSTLTGSASFTFNGTVLSAPTLTATTNVSTPSVTSTAALGITAGTTLTVASTGANAASFDSGTTGAVNIGTGANAKTVTVGSTNTTSQTKIQAGSGGISLTGAVVGSSTIDAVSGFKYNGTAGLTQTCSGGDVISNAVVQGGIITGGGCVANGGGFAPTLQNVYDNSGTPATIQLSTGKGMLIKDNSTTVGNIFQIQNSAGSTTYLGVTSSGINVSGTVTATTLNVNTVQTNGTPRIDVSGNLSNIGTISASGAVTAGTYNTATISGGSLSATAVNGLTVSGGNITGGTWNGSTVAVNRGGTGVATFTSNGILYGNGTGAIQATAAGATGQCLLGNTGAAPSWGSCGSGFANTSLSNLSAVNIGTVALNSTSNNLNLTTTTSGNIVLNSAGTIELQDGTNVTGNLGVTGTITGSSTIQGTQLKSTVATGTAPLTVNSTTLVANLNADQLDGHDSTYFQVAGSYATTSLNNLSAVNIGATALNSTSNNLNLTTTTSGNIILNSAGTIELQDATNVTGNLGVTGTITGSSTIQGTRLISTVATGTAPLTVTSTTLVTNLNADLLDGLNSTAFAPASGSGNYIQNQTASPQAAGFNINGTAYIGGNIYSGDTAGSTALAKLATTAGVYYFEVGTDSTTGSKADLRFTNMNNSGTNLVIQGSTGNVGIGTSNPGAYRFNVQGGDANFSANVNVGSAITAGTSVTANSVVNTPAIRPLSDSTSALKIQNAAGTATILNIDTTNNYLGINTTSPQTALDVNGSTSRSYNATYRTYNNVYGYRDSGNPDTGTLIITMPNGWTNTMMQTVINGYEYAGSKGAWQVVIGGYNFAATPTWVNVSAQITGDAPFSSVRLGYDGTHMVIMLGTTSTTWHYPEVNVTRFDAGVTSPDNWGSGWGSSFVTTEAAYSYIVNANASSYGSVFNLQGTGASTLSGTLIASSTSNSRFGNGTTGGIQIGDGTITKTSGSNFQLNSGLDTTGTINGGSAINAVGGLSGDHLTLNSTTISTSGNMTGVASITGISGNWLQVTATGGVPVQLSTGAANVIVDTNAGYGLVVNSGNINSSASNSLTVQAGTGGGSLVIIDGSDIRLRHNGTIGLNGSRGDLTVCIGNGTNYGNGYLTQTGNSGGCLNASSIVYKTNVVSLGDTLGILGQLRPVSFDWKTDSGHRAANGGFADYGLIAQEVAPLLPELTQYNADGSVAGLNYYGFIPFLIRGIQEQQGEIGDLQNATGNLTTQVAANTSSIADLSSQLATTNNNVGQNQSSIGNLQSSVSNLSAQLASGTFTGISVSGNADIGGNLTVIGPTTLQGTLYAQDAEFDGVLTAAGHIVSKGNAPTITVGDAIGTGDGVDQTTDPTVQIAGTDNAGSVTITTGSTGDTNGVLAHLVFAKAYDAGTAYNAVISATNGNATDLRVYIVKTDGGFDIVSKDAPGTSQTYTFDYIVLGSQQVAAN
jgi:hypothetical protein